jgi:hypothetical protein
MNWEKLGSISTTNQARNKWMIFVTAQPNMSYIIHFGSYCSHGFVSGDASPHLSLTSQNAYDKLAISIFNKTSYQTFTRRYGISQFSWRDLEILPNQHTGKNHSVCSPILSINRGSRKRSRHTIKKIKNMKW